MNQTYGRGVLGILIDRSLGGGPSSYSTGLLSQEEKSNAIEIVLHHAHTPLALQRAECHFAVSSTLIDCFSLGDAQAYKASSMNFEFAPPTWCVHILNVENGCQLLHFLCVIDCFISARAHNSTHTPPGPAPKSSVEPSK